jgi:hypothetical protein
MSFIGDIERKVGIGFFQRPYFLFVFGPPSAV